VRRCESYFDGSAHSIPHLFFSQFRTINSAPKMRFRTGARCGGAEGGAEVPIVPLYVNDDFWRRGMLCVLKLWFNGRVHCFSMQVIMNKSFLLNPKQNWLRSVLSFSRKTPKTHTLIPKNDVTELKTIRLL